MSVLKAMLYLRVGVMHWQGLLMGTLTPNVVRGLSTYQAMEVTFRNPLHKQFGLGRELKQPELRKSEIAGAQFGCRVGWVCRLLDQLQVMSMSISGTRSIQIHQRHHLQRHQNSE